MFAEDDLLPISALQHLAFCERQCALIHIERLWAENFFTAEGRVLHERVDDQGHEYGKDVRIERGLALRSLRLGLIGKADVVEFHRNRSSWIPFPVEYKRGRPKPERWDEIQICAQAFCLEEMLEIKIGQGAIFYGQPRRRQEVAFDDLLRQETETSALRLHELIHSGVTPKAKYEKKCDSCSLFDQCMPKVNNGVKSVSQFIQEEIES